MSTWENRAWDVIERVIRESGSDTGALKSKLSRAYPFGERRMWPYKVWLKCVKIALAGGSRTTKGTAKKVPADPSAVPLFEVDK